MTKVSRIPLRKEIEERIFEIFIRSLAKVTRQPDVKNLIKDLLSPVEQYMLAKRLAIAFLLYKQYDQRTISRMLKVGFSTINRVSHQLQREGEGYHKVIKVIIREEKVDEFWQKLSDTINEIFPPKGRDWSNWRKEQWINRMKRKKIF